MTEIRSELIGSVWKIEVVVVQKIAEGDTVVLIESMKMEIPISSPHAGTITGILVAEGESVEKEQLIAILE